MYKQIHKTTANNQDNGNYADQLVDDDNGNFNDKNNDKLKAVYSNADVYILIGCFGDSARLRAARGNTCGARERHGRRKCTVNTDREPG